MSCVVKGGITIMTKCIAEVGDIFVCTKDAVSVEGIDKCDLYPYNDSLFLGRALITKGAIYDDDGEVHFSVPFACTPLDIPSTRKEVL